MSTNSNAGHGSLGGIVPRVAALGVLLGLSGLAACGGGGAGGGASLPTTGNVVVRMHDAPTEGIEHVYVTIERVEVRREVDGADDAEDTPDVETADRRAGGRGGDDDRDGKGGRDDGKDGKDDGKGGKDRGDRGRDDGDDDNDVIETIASVPGQYDLLELQNGVEAVLGGGSFAPGRYHSIRLIIARDSKDDRETLPAELLKNYVVVEGLPYPLVVPSGEQTGIKLGHEFTIEAGVTTVLTLDFDVRRSVHQCGRGHVYRLKPRIRVVPKVVEPDGSEAPAAIAGTVTTTDFSGLPAGTVVSAQQNGSEVASVAVDELGGYALTLADGTYDLVAIAPGYDYASITGVVISGGVAAGSLDLAVAPASVGSIYGTVSPAGENLTVRLLWNGLVVATVGADPVTGEYLLDAVPAGDYTVEASDGTATASGAATVDGGAGTLVDLGL